MAKITPKAKRVQVLERGASLTSGDRDKTYGDPVSNMAHFAGMLTAYFSSVMDYEFSPEDAAQIMVMAKQSRCKANPGTPFHEDNYVDGATYLAIAAECREAMEK